MLALKCSPQRWNGRVALKAVILITIATLDAASTVFVITMGWARECNPTMAWLIEATSLEKMAIIKISGTLLLLLWVVFCRASEKFKGRILNLSIVLYIVVYIIWSILSYY